jgi:opacity protein-like surface antigen
LTRLIAAIGLVLLFAGPVDAQSDVTVRGFADIGSTSFSAERSFEAVLGSARGPVFGGGVEGLLPGHVFVNLRVSRFRRTGQRVFTFNDQLFSLGIPVTVTVVPIELTGGYRFDYGRPLVPYAGAGVGWYRYRERSEFADTDENVRDRFTGFHLLGGTEVHLARWVGAAFEAEWATVPDALGGSPNSVAREFQESNLGGFTIRGKVIVGRW